MVRLMTETVMAAKMVGLPRQPVIAVVDDDEAIREAFPNS
jgi:hypothetical protein